MERIATTGDYFILDSAPPPPQWGGGARFFGQAFSIPPRQPGESHAPFVLYRGAGATATGSP